MKAQGTFSPMNPSESEIFAFDFSKDLVAGDSVLANPPPVWTCAAASGPDTSPSARLDGNPALTGTQTQQRITDPVAGTVYVLSAVVKTAFGNYLDLWAFLPCRAVGTTGT